MSSNIYNRRGFATRAFGRIARDTLKACRRMKYRNTGLTYVAPNFLYFPRMDETSRIIDVGCSYEADFSMLMIRRHGARAIAVDPTRKHAEALRNLEQENRGRFTYLPFALSRENGIVSFHESKSNESGSLMDDHVNVVADEVQKYDVTAVSLASLLEHAGGGDIDIIKIDAEGAEYDLLDLAACEDLRRFKQMFIEFHHHAVTTYTKDDTWRIVERIRSCGFRSYSLDDHNFLFERI